MRGVTAKRLRKIAASLGVPGGGKYVPGGPLRRRAGFRHPETGDWVDGQPIARPAVLTLCTRRVYKEAKRTYKGLPPTKLVPEEELQTPQKQDFRQALLQSINRYYENQ